MREKLFIYNTFSAILKQIITILCGFILPRYILLYFGSNVNGLVSSITQFLGFITFLEMGIGSVIQSNLYEPLAKKDKEEVSKIIISAEYFFKKIVIIFLVYIAVLVIIFPKYINDSYDAVYTGSLIVIISISTIVQYYFGITYQLLLNADQRAYIQINLQTITILFNTIISIILMKLGASIQIIKIGSSLIFIIRPLIQSIYVKKHYNINHSIKLTYEPIKQKWNGFAQHLAGVVVANTDVTVLTLYSSLANVSIYSVYYNVVFGINNTIMTLITGLESMWGNMLANKEDERLMESFKIIEWIMHVGCTLLFTITSILIIPFISIYTNGINDANYIVPIFSIILTAAYGVQCLRVPYFRIIKAAGHYKQTQNGSIIQMITNIIISVLLVRKYGLNGVAIGTFVAMLYHTTYFAWYLRKNILKRSFGIYLKYILLDIILSVICFFIGRIFIIKEITYIAWIMLAIKVSIVCLIITMIFNLIFYYKYFMKVISFFKQKIWRKK